MTTDTRAHGNRQQAQASAPEDYDAILAAVSETPRGRWFLGEYARRNRTADTAAILGEISRLETLLALQHPHVAANRADQALQDVATVLALTPEGQAQTEGLTPDVVANLALSIGQSGETIRDALLTARGAALSMRDHQHDPARAARFQQALDRHMTLIDEQAGHVLHGAARIEALAQVIAQLRERLRIVLRNNIGHTATAMAAAMDRPAPAIAPPSPITETERPAPTSATPEPETEAEDGAEAVPAFEQVWHVPPAPAHARLRHVAALMQENDGEGLPEADLLLDDNPLVALAQSARTAHAGRTLAELDRLSYSERAALFA